MKLRSLARSWSRRLPDPVRTFVRTKVPAVPWATYEQARGTDPLLAPTGPSPRPTPARRPPDAVLREVERGGSLGDACAREVRARLAGKKVAQAQAIGESLVQRPETAAIGHALAGLVAAHRKLFPLAGHHFAAADVDYALRVAPVEYTVTQFRTDPAAAKLWATRMLQTPDRLTVNAWWEVVRHTFPARDLAFNDAVVEALKASYERTPTLWPRGAVSIPELERWLGKEHDITEPPVQGRVPFAILDYRQPDWSTASDNIGDWIQTLASLGNLVRHSNLRYSGPDEDAVAFVRELADRVRPELRLEGPSAEVELHVVERDASSYQPLPDGTWMLAFGWYMHPQFNVSPQFGFPFHPALRPVFVSFHCNNRSMMTPEAVEYLRTHAPIGCRDWTTVDLLLSLGVPAFFSGCLTTTVNTVFPDTKMASKPRTLYVDAVRDPVPAGAERTTAMYPLVRERSFTANMREAVDVLELYRHSYTKLVTKRLHCYLPATSLGVPVSFEPADNTIIRFNGLFRLDPERFDAMRTSMRNRLAPLMEAIVAGKSEDEVRQLWWDINEQDLALARERHDRPVELDPAVPGLVGAVRAHRSSAPATDGAVDVAVRFSRDQHDQVRRLLASARDATSRPVRAWLLTPSAPPEVTGVETHWVDTSAHVDESRRIHDLGSVVLHELIPASRVILLPYDSLVVADLAELSDLDLGDALIAARPTSAPSSSGFATFYRAATRLDDVPDVAYESYRDIHARHVFDFDAFGSGLMLLDLARLRDADATQTMLHPMLAYRYNPHEAWHYLVGGGYHRLPISWGYVPTRDAPVEPKVYYWEDSLKPWSPEYVAGKDLWKAVDVDRSAVRA